MPTFSLIQNDLRLPSIITYQKEKTSVFAVEMGNKYSANFDHSLSFTLSCILFLWHSYRLATACWMVRATVCTVRTTILSPRAIFNPHLHTVHPQLLSLIKRTGCQSWKPNVETLDFAATSYECRRLIPLTYSFGTP